MKQFYMRRNKINLDIKNCRLCFSKIFIKKENFLNLGNSPSRSQNLSKDKKIANKQLIKLKLYKCNNCGLLQLTNRHSDYYRSSIRSSIITNNRKLEINSMFSYIKKKFPNNKNVIEIGAGRGEYLNLTRKYFTKVKGYEFDSNLIKNKITKQGLTKFYPDAINKIFKNKKVDGIYCLNFLEHAKNVNQFFRNILSILKPGGFLFIEVPNFKHMYENKIFYDFTIEHLSYFDEKTLANLFYLNDINIIKKNFTRSNHNLSFLGIKNKTSYNFEYFKNENLKIRKTVKKFLNSIKNELVIWGACHHTFELLIKTELKNKVKYLVDSSKNKQNKFAPGTNIKIFNPKKLNSNKPNYILISASSYSDEVLKLVKKKFYFIENVYIVEGNKIKKV